MRDARRPGGVHQEPGPRRGREQHHQPRSASSWARTRRTTASWDTKGLSSWAMSRFHVNLPVNQIKKMTRRRGGGAAPRGGARADRQAGRCRGWRSTSSRCTPRRSWCSWAKEKFADRADAGGADRRATTSGAHREPKPPSEIVELIETPRPRGVPPPGGGVPGRPHAHVRLRRRRRRRWRTRTRPSTCSAWAKAKYSVELTARPHPRRWACGELRDELLGLQEQFLNDGKLDRRRGRDPQGRPEARGGRRALRQRFGWPLDPRGPDAETRPRRAEDADAAGRRRAATTARRRRPASATCCSASGRRCFGRS